MASVNRVTHRPSFARPTLDVNAVGSIVHATTPLQELRRAVLTYMLWENDFYESGESIALRIARLVKQVSVSNPEAVANLAVEARNRMKLRHVPLFIAREMARSSVEARKYVSGVLSEVVQRPDELTEFLAIYWKDGKQPLSAQVKKGLANAFGKFSEYSLAKFNRKGAVNLKDVVRLVHPTPADESKSAVTARLLKNELATPDTWEVALSAGADKKATFERLISEKKLGAIALLMNLRNMEQAKVCRDVIIHALETMDVSRVLPFRFITAARYAPSLEPHLERAMLKALEGIPKLKGRTALVIDNSNSMSAFVSASSELSRTDAAAALAILAREICEDSRVYAFGSTATEIPARRGFALRDAIVRSPGGSSFGGKAVNLANAAGYDRIIVLTDGQWHVGEFATVSQYARHTTGDAKDVSPAPLTNKAYMLNVGTYRNGVGYGKWFAIDGWSESVLEYISIIENEG